MSEQPLPSLAGFIRYLRQQAGFEHVGVGHYVRLEALLKRADPYLRLRLPQDVDAPLDYPSFSDLRLLLCPVFATSREQQDRFLKIIDDYLERFSPAAGTGGDEHVSKTSDVSQRLNLSRTPAKRSRKLRRLWIPAGALLVLLLALLFLLPSRKAEVPGNVNGPTPTPSSSPQVTLANNTAQANANSGVAEPMNSHEKMEPGGAGVLPSKTRTPGIPSITPEVTPAPPAEVKTSPSPLPSPTPVDGGAEPHYSAIILLAVGLSLFGFGFYEAYKFFQRQQTLSEQLNRKPPLVWQFENTEASASPYAREEFNRALLRLRQRQVAEFDRLDVPTTVAATLRSCGFPSLRYRAATKAPEYLILIDRDSFLDHQAQLFSELVAAVEREDLYTVCFFFGDPRLCCDAYGNYMHLSELQESYGEHRLLIFSDGRKLLDPMTGSPHPANQLFRRWEERAVLTPRPAVDWGRRETLLASDFFILPATLDGLAAVVDYFDTAVTPDIFVWRNIDKARPAPDLEQPGVVQRLRAYMSPRVFTWLCACAVYPELQWDLTLHLGALLSDTENLITEENLLKLVRLSWFRTGSIPDEIRAQLISLLSPGQEALVRQAVLELMEKSRPRDEMKGTVGEIAYRINIVAQRWLFRRDRESLDAVMENRVWHSKLESLPSPFLKVAQSSRLFRPALYNSGLPAFGLRTAIRFRVALALAALAWAAAYLLPLRLPPSATVRGPMILPFAAVVFALCAFLGYLLHKLFLLRPRAGIRSLLVVGLVTLLLISATLAPVSLRSLLSRLVSAGNPGAGNANIGNTNTGSTNNESINKGNTNVGNQNTLNVNTFGIGSGVGGTAPAGNGNKSGENSNASSNDNGGTGNSNMTVSSRLHSNAGQRNTRPRRGQHANTHNSNSNASTNANSNTVTTNSSVAGKHGRRHRRHVTHKYPNTNSAPGNTNN
ncbi:MAG: hypothetical protein QOJ70_2483 [Acidobacteriota bacterium]|jgi:hypothetical protein|nr:hypothetical protein [Acidobacteriota bacterium]